MNITLDKTQTLVIETLLKDLIDNAQLLDNIEGKENIKNFVSKNLNKKLETMLDGLLK